MAVFFLSFLLLLLVVLVMSVGVLMGKKSIKGSCGGMSALGMDTACDVCGGDRAKCDKEQDSVASEAVDPDALAYDAAHGNPTKNS